MALFRKEKRTIYVRKIKNFWEEFSHNRIGLAGIGILIFYVMVAVFTPYISPMRPTSQEYNPPRSAAMYAMPEWVRIFPQFQDLPPSFEVRLLENVTLVNSTVTDRATLQFDKEALNITFHADAEEEEGSILLHLTAFSYVYAPPSDFKLTTVYYETGNQIRYEIDLFLTTDQQNDIWDEWLEDPTRAVLYTNDRKVTRYPSVDKKIRRSLYAGLMNEQLFAWQYPNDAVQYAFLHPSEMLLSKKGSYDFYLEIKFNSLASTSTCNIHIDTAEVKFFGDVWGLLGSDRVGHDVWAQLIYGVRISLIVGSLAAVLSSVLGISFGVIAGYSGGRTDQIIMRGVDVLLCLPVLPILLILSSYWSFNVYYVILLIAIFGWQGLSRIVRSKVLSLKEVPFIESARAAGATSGYIMTRHIIPNVLPVVMAAMVLAVPGAILTEAALSFLGFGDPSVPTWGRMLYRSRTQGGFESLAWWYVIPPGLAITFLCLAFVFIGHALDEIVNPRLRRRR
ncbi:MAG: ABC transporter permease [Candidatus Bathyarchaeota archaeon]|nr:ABC transporter permease [Candidatus Bathyarchaeota archaeon]